MKRGFSLLEIVLALAILAGALAALGEVMRMGDQNAALVRDETQAEMLAESVMAELLCGARPPTAVNNAAFNLDVEPPWVYSISIDSTEYQELVAVHVSVAQQLAPELQPAKCDLVRWVLNPDFVTSQVNEAEQAAAQSTTGSSSSGNSNGSGSGTGGGGRGNGGGRQ